MPAGDRVALVLPNGADFVVAFLACAAARAIAAPLNPALPYRELAYYLQDAGAKAVIVAPDSSADAGASARFLGLALLQIDLARPATHLILRPLSSTGRIRRTDVASRPEPDDVALFLHTSGTTGRPKAVPISHGNLVASMHNIARSYRLTPEDRTLLIMPLFHVHGLVGALLATLAAGASAVVQWPKFSARAFWDHFATHECTWYTAVPTMHQILLKHADADYALIPAAARARLRFIRSCSSALAPPVLKQLERQFGAPVIEAYAMSEAAHQMTTNPLPPAAHKPGSVGKPVGLQVAILRHGSVTTRSDGGLDGERAPAGSTGEVVVRGQNVMRGYWNNANATKAAFVRLPDTGLAVGIDGAGHHAHSPVAPAPRGAWFRTGDEGYLDADGYLFLTGRIKELINRGGEKISPLEVDAALLAHPAVAEAVAFGADDVHYGQVVHAAVVLKDPEQRRLVTAAQLQDFARQRLAPFKVPALIHIVHELPRTATGKTSRKAIADHFQRQQPASRL